MSVGSAATFSDSDAVDSEDDDPLLAPTPINSHKAPQPASSISSADLSAAQTAKSPRTGRKTAPPPSSTFVIDGRAVSTPHLLGRSPQRGVITQRSEGPGTGGSGAGFEPAASDQDQCSVADANSRGCASADRLRCDPGAAEHEKDVKFGKQHHRDAANGLEAFSSTDGSSTTAMSRDAGSSAAAGGGAAAVMSQPHFVVEKRNEKLGRALRVTQRECVAGGTREIQTKIDVYDLSFSDCPVIFSVKHLHTGLWGRQTIVHKNLLLACMLADVNPPLEVPNESRRVFEQTEQQQEHLHTYMERVTPFIKYNRIPAGVSLYWWRAVGNGVAVMQNSNTGKMLFFVNRDKTVPSAVDTLGDVIKKAPSLPQSFFDVNPLYPLELADADLERIGDADQDLSPEELRDLVMNHWALEDGVGPWTTTLVLQVEGPRRRVVYIRYSIGVDEREPAVLAIQVHKNEPLVRDLKAFPVCVLQMTPRASTKREVYLAYKRARFFLQKLFNFHSAEGGHTMGAGSGGGSVSSRDVASGGGGGVSPRPTGAARAQSVRIPSRGSDNRFPGDTPSRQGARTPPRATPRSRRAVSHLRCSASTLGGSGVGQSKQFGYGGMPTDLSAAASRLVSSASQSGIGPQTVRGAVTTPPKTRHHGVTSPPRSGARHGGGSKVITPFSPRTPREISDEGERYEPRRPSLKATSRDTGIGGEPFLPRRTSAYRWVATTREGQSFGSATINSMNNARHPSVFREQHPRITNPRRPGGGLASTREPFSQSARKSSAGRGI